MDAFEVSCRFHLVKWMNIFIHEFLMEKVHVAVKIHLECLVTLTLFEFVKWLKGKFNALDRSGDLMRMENQVLSFLVVVMVSQICSKT